MAQGIFECTLTKATGCPERSRELCRVRATLLRLVTEADFQAQAQAQAQSHTQAQAQAQESDEEGDTGYCSTLEDPMLLAQLDAEAARYR